MTLNEILDELDALKDFVNMQQVHRLDTLKVAVQKLKIEHTPEPEPEPVPREIPNVGFEPLNFVQKKRAYKRKVK